MATLLLALAAAALVTACSGGSGTLGDPTPTDVIPVDACESVRDCVGGEQCEDGYCREMCSEEEECMGPLAICNLDVGLCAACIDDDDCGEGESCRTLFCGTSCGDGPPCAEGETCIPEESLCLPDACEEDRDCPGGFACDDGTCTSIGPATGECIPGTSRCDGDVRIGCSPRGREVEEDCSLQGARCVVQGTGVVCEPLLPTDGSCVDGTRGCANASTAWQCVDGVAEQERCAAGTSCQAGECVAGPGPTEPGPTEPGPTEPGPTDPPPTGACSDGEVGCVDEATPWWCEDGERVEGICFASTICAGGECVPEGSEPECSAGETGCVDLDTRWTCVDQSRVPSSCGTGFICVGGTCEEETDPGDDCGQTVATCSSPHTPASRVLVARVGDTITCSAAGSTGGNNQPATSYSWAVRVPSESAPAIAPSSTSRDVTLQTTASAPHVLQVTSSNGAGAACNQAWVQITSVERELSGLVILLAWRDELTGTPLTNQDLDLYLRRGTTGRWRDNVHSVYYASRTPTWSNDSGVTMSPVLVQDALRDGGPEMIHVPQWFTNETFSVGVHFFQAANRQPALLDLKVIAGGQVIWSREDVRISGEADFWHAFNFTGATPSIATVNNFSTLPL